MEKNSKGVQLLHNLKFLTTKNLKHFTLLFILNVLALTSYSQVISEVIKITGTVTEESGLTLPGVSIRVKGGQNGTVTNDKGAYSITLPSAPVTLVFTYLGYIAQEIVITDSKIINIILKGQTNDLNEVVVVGYGIQKKVNLTGSVATIDAKSLANRPISNLSSALSGLSSGVFVGQTSGRPGADGATIRIRGTGTLNSNNALVIIDGIQGSMDAVNPADVESISVLKDAASASIYGSLAANGVILITTKKGSKNKTTVSYSGIFSQTQPSNTPGFVTDYVRHMNLVNEGSRNIGQKDLYTQATIDAWTNANLNPSGSSALGVPNSIAFPNTNWSDVIFENNILQNHNISLNGGAENIKFLLSAGYLGNPGTMKNTELNRYQFRVNLEAKVAKFLTLGTQSFASMQTAGLGNTENAFNFLRQTTPGVYPFLDGKYGFPSAPEESSTANNILQYLNSAEGSNRESRLNTTVFANVDLFKGLKFETRFNYQTRFAENNFHNIPFEKWNFATNELKQPAATPGTLITNYAFDKNYTLTVDNVLRYATTIANNHDIGVLAGYNQNYFNYYDFSASKLGLTDADITTLGPATTGTIGGQEYDRSMRSWFGRANYAYKQRYLLEAVVRYDGSSRFAAENRFGFFPAFSAGWRLSEENFMKGINDYVDNLKLRGSWGRTGNNGSGYKRFNNDSGEYDYQSTYSTQNYSFNNVGVIGLAPNKIANKDLRWETTTLTDIGLDGSLLKGALNFEFDWYNKVTNDILFMPDVPITVGTSTPPTRNIAAVLNRGIEVTLGYQGTAGEFKYGASGNFAYNYNNVTTYKGKFQEGYTTDALGNKVYSSNLGKVTTGNVTRIVEGHEINEYYLYNLYNGNGTYNNADGTVNINGGPKDGMIRTPADLGWANAMIAAGYKFLPANTIGKGNIYYGDFVYADNNGDGSYGNPFDRQFTGASSNPKYNFGLQANASWKGLDLFMLWSGSAGMKYYWNAIGYNSTNVSLGNAVSTLIADDHYFYNEANPNDPKNNIDAKFPRLKGYDAQNYLESKFYLYNASYVKLKNLQIGYTFPNALTKKAGIGIARLYLSGENLFTITNYPGLDPEIGNQVNYPTMRQYSLGVNVAF
jgi:TonB-linked SusC/RagA family outer membrane protein